MLSFEVVVDKTGFGPQHVAHKVADFDVVLQHALIVFKIRDFVDSDSVCSHADISTFSSTVSLGKAYWAVCVEMGVLSNRSCCSCVPTAQIYPKTVREKYTQVSMLHECTCRWVW